MQHSNFVFGLVLIFRADWITNKIIPKASEKLDINLDKTDWIELTLIAICGLTILYSIPEAMQEFVSYIYFNPYDKNEKQFYWTNTNKASIFYSIFKLAIALLFISNARKCCNTIEKNWGQG